MTVDARTELERFCGVLPPEAGPDLNAVRLAAILQMSNYAEAATDPFERRVRLNDMQAAIQAARDDLEAIAEGLIFTEAEA